MVVEPLLEESRNDGTAKSEKYIASEEDLGRWMKKKK